MTSYPTQKTAAVRAMFARIAPRYDLLNKIMTFGQDKSWRRQAIRMLEAPKKARVLDVGAGTGDLSLMMSRSFPEARITAVDLTPGMLAVAKKRGEGRRIQWVIADAQHLPFARGAFDRVISAFLVRNVSSIKDALSEQARMLNPGGRMVVMETTPPREGLLRPLALFHLRRVVPLLGRLIARDAPAYLYLPQSIEDFISGERLAALASKAGFSGVDLRFRMMGTVSIVAGQRRFDVNQPEEKTGKKGGKSNNSK